MDERSSPDDASASRVSLVDSRRLLFEKIVTEQSSRSESTADDGVGISRRNGRLPRSSRADKVNSFRDELASPIRGGNDDDAGGGGGGGGGHEDADVANDGAETPAARRYSYDVEFGANDSKEAHGGRVSSVLRLAAAISTHDRSSPSSRSAAVVASNATTDARTSLLSISGASDASPPSGGNLNPVPLEKCLPPGSTLSSAEQTSPVPSSQCQSSTETSPPYCSKRISYLNAVSNGAEMKVAKPATPSPIAISKSSCSVSPSPASDDDVSPVASSRSSPLRLPVGGTTLANATFSAALTPTLASPNLDSSASVDNRVAPADTFSSRNTHEPVVVAAIDNETGHQPSAAVPPVDDDCESSSEAAADRVDEPSLSAARVIADAAEEKACPEVSSTAVSSDETDQPPSVPAIVDDEVGQTSATSFTSADKTGKLPCPPDDSIAPAAAASSAVSPDSTVCYPEELNPFGDDDDANDESSNPLEISSVNVTGEHESTNPFGSDSEDESFVESESIADKTNPFWSGSEEEQDEENPTPRVPVPFPRTVKKPITCSSPLPSPRPRPRVTTGCSSTEISPASSCRKLNGDLKDVAFRRSSGSINSTSRKKKPAPLPPPMQAASHLVVSQNEENQNANVEQMKIVDSAKLKSDDPTVSVTDLKQSANKKVVSPWKNKKRPAPARPTPQRRPVKEMPLEDIKVELDDIEIRYQELERQTTQLEENIRLRTESESAESAAVEEMVVQLFELVNEKNELFRRRSELVNMRKMHSLEVEQAEIEYQIRCLMLRPESNKTDTDKATEEALVKRLVEVVEKRNEIIDLMDQDRLRETVEDESVTTQLVPDIKKNGHEKKDKSKEKKKKNKKEKTKEPDDGDKHSPSKLIKQKFMTLRHNAKKLHPKLPD